MKTGNLKSKIVGLALMAGFTTLSAKAQQTRNVSDFSGIRVSGTFDIVISQSDANTVKIDVDEKEQSQIKTEVKDGILIISGSGSTDSDKPIRIGIKSLTNLIVSGSSDLKTDNQLICDKLSLESSGSGDINLNIKATEIKTQISGAGEVTLKGTAQLLDANVSGAGDLKASNLVVDKAKIKVSGAGDGKVNVKQSLDAEVSGSGDIIYKGKPVERNININGAGSIRESKSGTGAETASDSTKHKHGKSQFGVTIGNSKDDDDDEGLTPKDSLKKYNEGFKTWTGVEFGFNNLVDNKNSMNRTQSAAFLELDNAKSWQFGINLFEKNFHIYKNYINLTTGFGFDFNHYALKNNVTLNPNAINLDASKDSVNYSKNTFNVSYIKIPLMLEFNTGKNSDHNFHISVGAEFEYRIHSVLKQKFDIDGKLYKIKLRDDFNLAPFLYNATARIGYNNVTIFANYGLNGLFNADKGPLVYPVTAGININF